MLRELAHIQTTFSLAPFIIASTFEDKDDDGNVFGNYLCFGLDKITYGLHKDMLNHTSADFNYRRIWRLLPQKIWVLRIAEKFSVDKNGAEKILRPKPEFRCIVKPYRFGVHQLSRAHWNFYKNFFKLKNDVIKGYAFDNGETVELKDYKYKYDIKLGYKRIIEVTTVLAKLKNPTLEIIRYRTWSD